MEYIHKIKKLMCEELKSYENVSKVNEDILNDVWKLTDTIKNLDKIKMLEEGGSHNSYGSYDSYDEESSYRRGRGPGQNVILWEDIPVKADTLKQKNAQEICPT